MSQMLDVMKPITSNVVNDPLLRIGLSNPPPPPFQVNLVVTRYVPNLSLFIDTNNVGHSNQTL